MGINPTAWGYSVYQEVIDKLVKHGIPREQIASIGDADTDAKKQVLFDKVRAGTCGCSWAAPRKWAPARTSRNGSWRCITSTLPGNPPRSSSATAASCARATQRGGRDLPLRHRRSIRRLYVAGVGDQGPVYRPGDDRRQRRAAGEGHRRPGALHAEVKAIASGNPAVLTLAEADAELQRLAILKKHHADEQYSARKNLKELPEKSPRLEWRIATLAQDRATQQAHAADPITIGGRPYARKEALERLGERLKALPKTVTENRRFPLGVDRGLQFSLCLYAYHTPEICVEGASLAWLSCPRRRPPGCAERRGAYRGWLCPGGGEDPTRPGDRPKPAARLRDASGDAVRASRTTWSNLPVYATVWKRRCPVLRRPSIRRALLAGINTLKSGPYHRGSPGGAPPARLRASRRR